jgi:hypothetical protein
MKTVNIPQQFVEEFTAVASNNVDQSGKLIETLALLVGYKDGAKIQATELLFPNQYGDASKVVDNGN